MPVELPVKVQYGGDLRRPLSLVNATAAPEEDRDPAAAVAAAAGAQYPHRAARLEEITKTEVLTVGLILPPYARFPSATPPKVRVTVTVASP